MIPFGVELKATRQVPEMPFRFIAALPPTTLIELLTIVTFVLIADPASSMKIPWTSALTIVLLLIVASWIPQMCIASSWQPAETQVVSGHAPYAVGQKEQLRSGYWIVLPSIRRCAALGAALF